LSSSSGAFASPAAVFVVVAVVAVVACLLLFFVVKVKKPSSMFRGLAEAESDRVDRSVDVDVVDIDQSVHPRWTQVKKR